MGGDAPLSGRLITAVMALAAGGMLSAAGLPGGPTVLFLVLVVPFILLRTSLSRNNATEVETALRSWAPA